MTTCHGPYMTCVRPPSERTETSPLSWYLDAARRDVDRVGERAGLPLAAQHGAGPLGARPLAGPLLGGAFVPLPAPPEQPLAARDGKPANCVQSCHSLARPGAAATGAAATGATAWAAAGPPAPRRCRRARP